MVDIGNPLKILVDVLNLKTPQGIKALKVNSRDFIWVWYDRDIIIYETSLTGGKKLPNECSQSEPLEKYEVNIRSCVIDIFQVDEASVCVLDQNGVIYSFHLIISSPSTLMEVEDLFHSPDAAENTMKWKETIVAKINDCDCVKNLCLMSSALAILAVKDENLIILVYSLPEYNLKFLLDLKKYPSQEAVLSSCITSSMSSSLKDNFKEHLDILDMEVIVIGLKSGLILWFCTSTPQRGPFVLFYAYQKVQSIHWIKGSELCTHLLIVLSSGQIIIFGDQKQTTQYLPESVKTSCCLQNLLVTSNFIDCYSCEIQLEKDVKLNCVSLPVKGVCAVTFAPGSEGSMIAATVHGSVYCFNPKVSTSENPPRFTLPDQSLLDTMFVQTQNLERIYKQLDEEERILKAISATVAASCTPDLFKVTVQVLADEVFSVIAQLTMEKLVFLKEIWLISVEIIGENGSKQTSFTKMEEDFSNNKELTVNVSNSLSIGDVVTIELIHFLENQQPLLIVPVGKVEIDACYLMTSQMTTPSTSIHQESLESILRDLNYETSRQTLQECKLVIKLSEDYPVNLLLFTILKNSQQRFSPNEWDKLTSGKKFTAHIRLCNIPVLMDLQVQSRELAITSCNTKLCHQVKEAVVRRLRNSVRKCIPENLTLDVQALHQSFEIESLKEDPNFQTLDLLRKNLRSTVSAKLPV